nr:FkbM family methyltransferase [Natronomonas gomsonensis]
MNFDEALDLASNTEKDIIIDVLSNLNSEDVFYDVGARTGKYSLKVAQLSDSPQAVVAFEPTNSVNSLRRTAVERSLDIEIVDEAIGTHSKSQYYRTVRNGHVTLTSGPEEVPKEDIEVIDGSEISDRRFPDPTVVKIDVNGWDWDVSKALKPLLAK